MASRSSHRLRRISLPGALIATLLVPLAACERGETVDKDAVVYTLYRDSVAGESPRVHVASFDAAENEIYNRNNCEQAQNLFQHQRGVQTRFWCEKGRFKKTVSSN